MTSDGQEPTRNSSLISGRRSSNCVTTAIQFVIRIRQPGEVALVDDRGGEPRFGENHDAGGGLDQVRAGARADHQEERVLDLAVQPDDAGQATEHFPLAALAQDRPVVQPSVGDVAVLRSCRRRSWQSRSWHGHGKAVRQGLKAGHDESWLMARLGHGESRIMACDRPGPHRSRRAPAGGQRAASARTAWR